MDDVMDDLTRELFRTIFTMDADHEEAVQRAVQLALVGRYYERVADHAVNVGERVDYMVTGTFHEHPTTGAGPSPEAAAPIPADVWASCHPPR